MLGLFEADGNNCLGEHQSHFENAFMKYTNSNWSLFCITHPHKSKVYWFDSIMPGFPYIFN